MQTDAAKLANVKTTRSRQCWDLVTEFKPSRCSSNMKPRFRAEWVVLRDELCILTSCCLSPMRRNSVLAELSVSRSRKISVVKRPVGGLYWNESQVGETRGWVVCRQHRDDDSQNEMKWVLRGVYTWWKVKGVERSLDLPQRQVCEEGRPTAHLTQKERDDR